MLLFSSNCPCDVRNRCQPVEPSPGVRCVSAHPVVVPPKVKDFEPYQRAVEAATDHATAVAERWAQTGHFDPLGYEPPPGVEVRPEHHKAWPSPRLTGRDGLLALRRTGAG